MSTPLTTVSIKQWHKSSQKPVSKRGRLRKGEILRLEGGAQTIRIISGLAWLTQHGADIFAGQGEEVCLLSSNDPILMSGLGNVPLDYEIVGC